MDYKKTINLPKTDFPIKANPKIFEEEILSFWGKEKVYEEMLKKNISCEKYILHDGPPYANGDIHLGHAINKILKDIVVKSKSMSGFFAPFVPGWDCHGLPIETQMIKELGVRRQKMDILEFRKKCYEYAMRYVDIQRKEFIRLGVFGDWYNPYLTLDPSYEERVVALFGILAERGYVYRGLKPIHWCVNCETALAEAEIEYEDEKSHSIYVKFRIKRVESGSPILKHLDNVLSSNASIIIWTTTPWTLPANVAVAVNPDFEYVALSVKDEIYILAEGLLNNFTEKIKLKDKKVVAKFKGKLLEGLLLKHPFLDRDVVTVLSKEFVTLEQGTGAVHIAPGHGEEDYKIGLDYKLPIVMPVDEKGYFKEEAGPYSKMRYDEANDIIISDMKKLGTLVFNEEVKHSYPHCWRCKKPVIFRATEQWFISVDHNNMRLEALKAIGDTNWFPSWGENRIRGMIEVRPDWCISRQRSWGVPIPAFYCENCGKPAMTGEFNKRIREIVKLEGSDAWFKKGTEDILNGGEKCPSCGSGKFRKETDILDVWFESGASHFAVLESREELRWPADLYLEGSDQHRGWFQTSLLTSVPSKGRAPYNSVLTHGFTVDEQGRKMSKSLGNVVDPQDVVKEYGADVLRLFVASTDFRGDMSASSNILRQVNEAYTKIRNTCRFMLGNLYDFDIDKDAISYEKLFDVDKFALLRLARLIDRIKRAYDSFEFHIVFHSIRDFSINDMSALYLDIIKDRLYCSKFDSLERRSAQTTLYIILDSIVKLIAPVLSFTAEDIWRHIPGKNKSIFLEDFPKINKEWINENLEKKWDVILKVRQEVYREIEKLRADKKISSSLEANVKIKAESKIGQVLIETKDISDIFIVSSVEVDSLNKEGLEVNVEKSKNQKCQRCWNLRPSVGKDSVHKTLCERCVRVVEELKV